MGVNWYIMFGYNKHLIFMSVGVILMGQNVCLMVLSCITRNPGEKLWCCLFLTLYTAWMDDAFCRPREKVQKYIEIRSCSRRLFYFYDIAVSFGLHLVSLWILKSLTLLSEKNIQGLG